MPGRGHKANQSGVFDQLVEFISRSAFYGHGLVVSHSGQCKGNIRISHYLMAIDPIDSLHHITAGVADAQDFGVNFQKVIEHTWHAVVNVEVDQGQGLVLFGKELYSIEFFKKRPTGFFQKTHIAGVVKVAIVVEVVASDLDADIVGHGI